jgi:hypothetical protein
LLRNSTAAVDTSITGLRCNETPPAALAMLLLSTTPIL